MIVVDTSAWIEWVSDSPLRAALAVHWPEPHLTLVPTLVQLELAKWLTRTVSEEVSDPVIAYTMRCRVVDLDTRVALKAAEVALTHKLATADAIIFATALDHDASLLTCDAHFEGLPNTILVRKTGR